jgi:hypothetical protein
VKDILDIYVDKTRIGSQIREKDGGGCGEGNKGG